MRRRGHSGKKHLEQRGREVGVRITRVEQGHRCHTPASLTDEGLGLHVQTPHSIHPHPLPKQEATPIPISLLAADPRNGNDDGFASPTDSSQSLLPGQLGRCLTWLVVTACCLAA